MSTSLRMTQALPRPALLLLLAIALPAQAALPLEAVRVALPAERTQGDARSTLLPRTMLAAGDRVLTGPRGRATLQLAGLGLVTLGGSSRLLVHSADPPEAGRGALLRLALEQGALRLDARGKSGFPPQDFRVNLGRLRMRVLGAEIFAELTGSGESVCLLEGAVEVLSDLGAERLDQPGHCLLFTSAQQRLLVRPDTSETLARKLLRTAFAEDYVARMEAQQGEAGVSAAPRPAESPAPEPAPRPATIAASPASTAAPAAAWTVVVASPGSLEAAQAEVARLRAQGLAADVLSTTQDGVTRHRVTVGRHPSRAQAATEAAALAARGLRGAWVLRQP